MFSWRCSLISMQSMYISESTTGLITTSFGKSRFRILLLLIVCADTCVNQRLETQQIIVFLSLHELLNQMKLSSWNPGKNVNLL